MSRNLVCPRMRLVSVLVFVLIYFSAVYAQTSSFTYQGRLTDNGTPANGNYDLQFALFDSLSGGSQVGSTQTVNTVPVSNGIFSVNLDFGSGSFSGASRFLEISARPSGGNAFTLLTPRQSVTATPYSIRSLNAGAADTLSNTCSACVSDADINAVAGSKITGTIPVNAVPAGSGNYIQNTSSQQPSTNFNISGDGFAGGTLNGNVVNSATQYNIGGNRVVSVSGSSVALNSNTFVGVGAGVATTPDETGNGTNNSFFGHNAGQSNTTGFSNSFFGINAGDSNQTTGGNAFFGFNAGLELTSGFANAFFGADAGQTTMNSTRNTAIGFFTDVSDNLTNATAIGAGAKVTQSNSIVLGSINGINQATADTSVGIGTTAPRSGLEVKRNWDGSFGAITVTGDRPTIRFSGGATANNEQWILHLGSAAGLAPAGSLSFFFGGTGGTAYGNPILSVTPTGTVIVTNLGAGGSQLCRNGSGELSNCSSSLRYKTNVLPFAGGLEILDRLRPISFEWKQDHVRDIGLGAEEVERVEPLLTFRNDQGEIEGVKYNQLSAVFVNAFKEQQAEIQKEQIELKRAEKLAAKENDELQTLRAANAALDARLRMVEQRLWKHRITRRTKQRRANVSRQTS